MGRTSVRRQQAYRDREKAKEKAMQEHEAWKKERTMTIMEELCQYVKREPIHDDGGKFAGYAYRVRVPEDFYQRFEELAHEYGMTIQQLTDEAMTVYLQEVQRLKDERN